MGFTDHQKQRIKHSISLTNAGASERSSVGQLSFNVSPHKESIQLNVLSKKSTRETTIDSSPTPEWYVRWSLTK